MPASAPSRKTVSLELRQLLSEGSRLFAARRYLEAAELNQKGYRKCRLAGETAQSIRFLNNLGASWLAVFRYRQAMDAFLQARTLAEATGEFQMAGAMSQNIATLYLQMGEITSAAAAVERGLEQTPRAGVAYRAQLLVTLAKVMASRDGLEAALPIYYAAIAAADRQADSLLMAQVWNLLGYEFLRRNKLEPAERALAQAFLLRRLNGNRDLDHSYRMLGLLRLRQGDLAPASALLEQAVRWSAKAAGTIPNWSAYYFRGQARLAQGRTAEALEDFRMALGMARRWRLEVLPADAVRVSTEVRLAELADALVAAAGRLYDAAPNAKLLADSFQAAEENRATSLRALLLDEGWPARLPAAYGETLARLRAAEASLLGVQGSGTGREVERLQAALTEMEVAAGLDYGSPSAEGGTGELLRATRRALRPDECLLSFHLGEAASWRWAVTRGGGELHRLAPRARLERSAVEFTAEMLSGSPAAADHARRLYQDLFGGLGAGPRTRRHWLLALDGMLFRLPAAALVAEGGRFLVERHSLRFVPGAHMLLCRAARPPAAPPGRFVGVGDAIYNRADPRWATGGHLRPGVLELPRLAATARELRICAAAWAADRPLLLEGRLACRERLAAALASRPAVVHVAAHVLPRKAPGGGGLIALSLLPSGEPELLGPVEIASWRGPLGLVALSGCSSGAAAVLPGAGLMGLTRAWLAAGANAVAGSFWPTPDDEGELWLAFYRHYHRLGGAAPATALQQAQIEMLHSLSWRAAPRYWAAYFLLSRD